jgi:3-phosphoshikimate 1-carboxyvinyltransferase
LKLWEIFRIFPNYFYSTIIAMQKKQVVRIWPPSGPVKERITLPASKSISNRLLVIKALSEIDFRIINLSESRDTLILEQALHLISDRTSGIDPITIDVADAGTPMRFLAALLSITPGKWLLTGNQRMQERPIGALVEALRALGAIIDYATLEGFPPISITGRLLDGGEVTIEAGISSQFISALMLIAPSLPDGLTIHKLGNTSSAPYIAMTALLMQQAGVKVEQQGGSIHISHQRYKPMPVKVDADWSAASFWYEIAAFSPDPGIRLTGLHASGIQGDEQVSAIFTRLGVKTEYSIQGTLLRKSAIPAGSPFSYDFTSCPDLLIPVAVACAGLQIEANLHGLKALRLKESDRLHAISTELVALGYHVTILSDDALQIMQSEANTLKDNSHIIETYNDHRMAMAFAPLSLLRPGICISNPDVVGKSYPRYWNNLRRAGFVISPVDSSV